jgi:glycosyltransferase involved in cell wall biosynthesis
VQRDSVVTTPKLMTVTNLLKRSQEGTVDVELEAQPALTVVIPTYNGARFLGEQLQALAAESPDGGFEVVIADNGSSDSTVQLAQSFDDQLVLRVIDASTQRGQTFARNTGAAAARSPLLVFLDQDDMVAPGYLSAMAGAMETHAVVAARIDVKRLNAGWLSEVREIVQTEQLPVATTPWAYGCSLGIRKEVFDRLGGFDVTLLDAGEDVDLCRRLHEQNIPLWFERTAVLHYRFPETLSALYGQGRRYGVAQVAADNRNPDARASFPVLAWSRGLLGALRLVTFGNNRGARGRGAFLLGRRLGVLEGELRFRTRSSAYPRRH